MFFFFSKTYFYHKKLVLRHYVYSTHQVSFYHFFIVEIIVESVNLIRCQNRKENYYYHDGEQLGFDNKVHIKTQGKIRCSCNLYLARNEEFQFILQNLYSRNSQSTYSQ